ncbi:MAG: ABC transporter substrate-binding protein [Chloroflexi bacterium]|nr:ABC transporter substrate-binding protein [Chloroflexota bacterium]
MEKRKLLPMASCLTVLGLLLTSCASAVTPTATPKPAARPPATPVAAPAAPTPGTAAPTPSGKTAEQPRYGGVLTISTLGDPISLDMQQEASFRVANVLQLAYNGVTQFDANSPQEVIGDLAKNWQISKDGLTYTFNLNESAKFHDGTPFTSEDVRFSFERMVAPPRGIRAPRRADLAAIGRIETPDKNAVKFILKYPSASFLDVISSGWMVVYSKPFVEKRGDMLNLVMGTGPYKLKSYTTGTSLDYAKNPDYFVKGRPYLDGITFYIIKDSATRLAAFRTGRVKLTGPGDSGLSPTDAEIVKNTMPQAVMAPYPGLCYALMVFQSEQKPWTDIRVRQAASLAIDRQKAIDVLAQGYGELWSSFPGKWSLPREELLKMPGWRQPKDADIGEAKRLLAEAGYPDGFTVKALVRAEKLYEEVAVFVADQLSKLGIKLDLDVKEQTLRAQLLWSGNFNMGPMYNCMAYPDPANIFRYWAPPENADWGQNWQRSGDKRIWELFDKQASALDVSERTKIVHELDRRMTEGMYRPIIYWRNSIIGLWPEVKNRGKAIGDFSFQKYQDIWLAKS